MDHEGLGITHVRQMRSEAHRLYEPASGVSPAVYAEAQDRTGALRVEALKWWLLGVEPSPLDAETGVTLDISHSRTRVLVSGPEAPACLNRLLPIDLRQDRFVVNQVASGGIHHVGVTLWRSKTGYELFLPRGFAESLWELLIETAEQFGLEIV
mgnify:CR=1 FL=1